MSREPPANLAGEPTDARAITEADPAEVDAPGYHNDTSTVPKAELRALKREAEQADAGESAALFMGGTGDSPYATDTDTEQEYAETFSQSGLKIARAESGIPTAQLDALPPAARRRHARERGVTWPDTETARERLFDTITFYSQSDAPERYGDRDGVNFDDALYLFDEGGDAHDGYDAFRELFRQFQVFLPLAIGMKLPPVAAVGRRVYRYVAEHRSRHFTCGIDAEEGVEM